MNEKLFCPYKFPTLSPKVHKKTHKGYEFKSGVLVNHLDIKDIKIQQKKRCR